MFLSCRRSLQLLSAPSYKRGAGASKKPTGGGPSSVEVAYAWHGDANIGAMGATPFLIAAGVGTGGKGTGLASATSTGFPPNMAIMDLLLAHGADVNAQVTDTMTYSLRISRAPSATEGMTALHVAAQKGRADEVRYLLEKGAKTDLLDGSGRKPIDLAGTGGAPTAAAPAPPAGAGNTAQIRALLQNTTSGR